MRVRAGDWQALTMDQRLKMLQIAAEQNWMGRLWNVEKMERKKKFGKVS